jgi:hypothetical protein
VRHNRRTDSFSQQTVKVPFAEQAVRIPHWMIQNPGNTHFLATLLHALVLSSHLTTLQGLL